MWRTPHCGHFLPQPDPYITNQVHLHPTSDPRSYLHFHLHVMITDMILLLSAPQLLPTCASPHLDRLRHFLFLNNLPSPLYPPPVPNLELHSAAASGNVGLVHYALTHGQPVNSVLHGVLPLHAACSGGSLSVVRMLIEQGADVNAPRLPRRYSDGKKGTAPSVGTAGEPPPPYIL